MAGVLSYLLYTLLLTHLGAGFLLQLCLEVGHRALNLLIRKCLVLILEDEAQGIRLLALGELVALVYIEE